MNSIMKPINWHNLCNKIYFVLLGAIILGGRPKSVSEEDVSARFF